MSPSVDAAPPRGQSWLVLLAIYWLTSVVEALGVSQIFAFLPLALRDVGLPETDVPPFVGIFTSLIFILGLPLVPLWGVWADKISRKAVIIRSAIVEAVVFAGIALSREPWQLAVSLLLVGLQLGNTGVMLAALRDVVPARRLGTAIAFFGASGPIGFAVGPALGGLIVDGLGWTLSTVFWVSAGLSVGTALLLAIGSREVRPANPPTAPILRLAYGAVRGVFADPVTRRLFAIFGVAILARQMTQPYVPLVVEVANGGTAGLASAIALVVGTASLAGAAVSPLTGNLGDRVGFRPVLVASLAASGIALVAMPFATGVPVLALVAMAFATANAAVSAMIFALLAVEVPTERRSATLNLVYLPLYLAGIVGPATGAIVVAAGLPAPFLVAGIVVAAGAIVVARSREPARAVVETTPMSADGGEPPAGVLATPAGDVSRGANTADDDPPPPRRRLPGG